jgi:hypothetical protein
MAIGTCRLIGIEGAHGTGKSTLALAVAADCKRRHMHAGCLVERARQSPFIEDAVIHKTGPITIHGELHLVALQIAHEQGLARHHDLLVCDKTVANVLGYSRLLLGQDDSRSTQNLLRTLEAFLSEYAKFYDQVFYSEDLYELQLTRDPFRPVDPKFQRDAASAIREACIDLKISLDLIPTGLDHQDKVEWVVDRILDRA